MAQWGAAHLFDSLGVDAFLDYGHRFGLTDAWDLVVPVQQECGSLAHSGGVVVDGDSGGWGRLREAVWLGHAVGEANQEACRFGERQGGGGGGGV
jgi:hypothetical protein